MNSKIVTCVDLEGRKYQVKTSELTWRPSAYGIVIRSNHVLLCRHFGKYNLPGGGIELGESIEEALSREIGEETGIEIARPRLVAADSDFFKPPYSNDYIQSILLYFYCEPVGGELSMDGFDEHEQVYAEMPEWVPLDSIDDWKITSSKDFRPHIKQVLQTRSGTN